MQQVEDKLALTDFLDVLVHVLGVLYVGDDLHLKLTEVREPFSILADAVREPLLVSFAYHYQKNLHYIWVC